MHVKHLRNRLRLVFLRLINQFIKAGTQQNKDICVHIKRRKEKGIYYKILSLKLVHSM